MQEDCRSGAGDDRIIVVAEDDDAIVETVGAPQGLGAGGVRQAHLLIVQDVAGVVAPAVVRLDRGGGKSGPWRGSGVGAKEQPPDRPDSGRRRSVSLSLRRRWPDTGAAERATEFMPLHHHVAIRPHQKDHCPVPNHRAWRSLRNRCMLQSMARSKTILIIDDDDDLRGLLREQLELQSEFAAVDVASAKEGLDLAAERRPDLILLDVDLPDINGREVCRLLREQGIIAPVIMLTAADGEDATIMGLESGASDYITKPFRFTLLLARIRAQIRAHEQSDDIVLRVGPYEFRPAGRLLVDAKGRKLRLTDKEANILKYLYRAGDKPVTREELLAEVWGYNAGVTTHTLETHVYRLRQKIEPEAGATRLLLTEAGGYRLAS